MENYIKPVIATQMGAREIVPLAGLTLAQAAVVAASAAGFLYGLSKKDARPVTLPRNVSVLQEMQNRSPVFEK